MRFGFQNLGIYERIKEMNIRTFATTACLSICTATAGLAATFDYSVTFENAVVVSGSVEGTL